MNGLGRLAELNHSWNFVVIRNRSWYHRQCCPDGGQVGHLIGSTVYLSTFSMLFSGLNTFNIPSN